MTDYKATPEQWEHVHICAGMKHQVPWATADQVVPPAFEEEWRDRNQALPLTKMVEIRLKLLAIADELEAQ